MLFHHSAWYHDAFQKNSHDQAIEVLVVPVWSTQSWFLLFLQQVYKDPSMLPDETSLTPWLSGATPTMEKNTPVDGMSCLRDTFTKNLSGKVTNIIMTSWWSGTKRQFPTYIEKWTARYGMHQQSLMATLTPLEKQSLKHLTLKPLMLLLLVTGQRGQSKHL